MSSHEGDVRANMVMVTRQPRLSQERHGKKNVAKPLREDDGGLPAFTEYSSVRFSPLCGGLTLLSMNPYSAWAFGGLGFQWPSVGKQRARSTGKHDARTPLVMDLT